MDRAVAFKETSKKGQLDCGILIPKTEDRLWLERRTRGWNFTLSRANLKQMPKSLVRVLQVSHAHCTWSFFPVLIH